MTTGATCFRFGHHDAGGMLSRPERVAGSGDEVGDVAAADKPELTEAQKTLAKKRTELASNRAPAIAAAEPRHRPRIGKQQAILEEAGLTHKGTAWS